MREIWAAGGPISGIMRTAAETEPDITELLHGMLRVLQGITQFVKWLAANGPLRDGLTVEVQPRPPDHFERRNSTTSLLLTEGGRTTVTRRGYWTP